MLSPIIIVFGAFPASGISGGAQAAGGGLGTRLCREIVHGASDAASSQQGAPRSSSAPADDDIRVGFDIRDGLLFALRRATAGALPVLLQMHK
jgi:hypothetical protein